jgi:AraC-like DNA-binding protein
LEATGNGILQPLSFSTESVRRQDQFEYWRHTFEHVTDLLPDRPRSAGYKAKCKIYNIRNFVVVRLSRPGCIIEHSNDAIRANNIDHWMISAFHRGRGILRAFDQETRIESGQTVITHNGHPFRMTTSDHLRTNFHIPRDCLAAISGTVDRLFLTQRSAALQGVLNNYLFYLADALPKISYADAERISEATGAVLNACIVPTRENLIKAAPALRATLLEKARGYIGDHLADADLAADTLRRFLGVSRATLYRLFESVGGVERYIRYQRLIASNRALRRGDARLAKQVWTTYGFASASDFSRAFKREFGYSPRDAIGLAATGHGSRSEPGGDADLSEFRHWIQSLNL